MLEGDDAPAQEQLCRDFFGELLGGDGATIDLGTVGNNRPTAFANGAEWTGAVEAEATPGAVTRAPRSTA